MLFYSQLKMEFEMPAVYPRIGAIYNSKFAKIQITYQMFVFILYNSLEMYRYIRYANHSS